MRMFSFLTTVFCAASVWGIQNVEISADQLDFRNQTYYFGTVAVGQQVQVTYNLTNTGDQPLRIEKISISGMFFDARTNCPETLPPRGQCRTRIYYWPQFEGTHHGRLVWYTSVNDVELRLWGDSYRY